MVRVDGKNNPKSAWWPAAALLIVSSRSFRPDGSSQLNFPPPVLPTSQKRCTAPAV